MEYVFTSIFNKEKEYTIETDEPLELYDIFSLSIGKFNPKNKSYSYDNIVCILKYCKYNESEAKTIELDPSNFDGYHMFVEAFKQKKAVRMGEPLELSKSTNIDEYANVNLDNADTELKAAFAKYVDDSKLLDVLFKCFLKGVSYGKIKRNNN